MKTDHVKELERILARIKSDHKSLANTAKDMNSLCKELEKVARENHEIRGHLTEAEKLIEVALFHLNAYE